jgi:uncharacterized repeat protein (TIGR03803 family)
MSVVSQANTYTFLVGTMTLDDAGLLNTNLPFIKAAHFTGTEPYPGHGPMDLRLLAAYQDALAPETNALGSNAFFFSIRADFQSVLPKGVAVATNSPAAGFAILLNATQFATNLPSIPIDTNNPTFDPTPSLFADYINSVVLPLARQRHPLFLICGTFGLTTIGSIPAGPAAFPALSTQCTFVGMEFSSTNTNTAPYIVTQPAGQEKPLGATASLVVAATGTGPLHFQWQKNETNLTDGGNISGATTTNLTISNLSVADTGVYSVIVSNTVDAVPSIPAVLAVLSPPTLYAFTGGNDGGGPVAGLVQAGNLDFYGTTFSAGADSAGTIFQVSPVGQFQTLYTFTDMEDGGFPAAGLAQGTNGYLYGTTTTGGSSNGVGYGTAFQIATNGQFTNLLAFNGGNGDNSRARLLLGKDGNFYGTTSAGGMRNFGTVFQFSPGGALTVLHSFTDGSDGFGPLAGLIQGTNGLLYGTASGGGTNGFGTVFQITTNGLLTTLVSFNNTNGATPRAGLVQGKDGNFYGTTSAGGSNDFGTIFQMTPSGVLTTLYSFGQFQGAVGNALDGASPEGSLILASDGNLYGTTAYGGPSTNIVDASGDIGFGLLFKFVTNGVLTNVVVFNGTNGTSPEADLVQAADGKLYGTTIAGGPFDQGTVFQVSILPSPPVIRSVSNSNGTLTLTWSALAGRNYQLQYATNLPSLGWSNLGNVITATNATATASDVIAGKARFYRVELLP